MSGPDGASLQILTLLAAFWTALFAAAWRFGRMPAPEATLRLTAGLALGAATAHVGWALLHLDQVAAHPSTLLDPAGASVVFAPLGMLLAVPWSAPPEARTRHLAAAFGALPLALAVARVGCYFGACCYGTETDLPWGLALREAGVPRHPVVWFDAAAMLGLFLVARRLPPTRVAPVVLVGIGTLRVAAMPFRAEPPLGEPVVPVWLPACACVAAGLLLAAAEARPRDRGREPAPAPC